MIMSDDDDDSASGATVIQWHSRAENQISNHFAHGTGTSTESVLQNLRAKNQVDVVEFNSSMQSGKEEPDSEGKRPKRLLAEHDSGLCQQLKLNSRSNESFPTGKNKLLRLDLMILGEDLFLFSGYLKPPELICSSTQSTNNDWKLHRQQISSLDRNHERQPYRIGAGATQPD